MSNPAPTTAHGSEQAAPSSDAGFALAPRFTGLLSGAGLASSDALFSYAHGESLAKPGLASWRERIRLTIPDGGQARTFYLKRFTNPPAAARRQVRRCGNGARSVAGAEWNWLHAFRAAGMACAEPVALAEEFVGGRERRSAIIMASVPGKSLETWAREWQVANHAAIAPLISATSDIVARLHGMGCAHRDLYLAHLFMGGSSGQVMVPNRQWTPGAPGDNRQSTGPLPDGRGTVGRGSDHIDSPTAEAVGHPLVHIIDLQRVFRPCCCFRRWVVKDLASLYFSALDQLPRGMLSRTQALRWLKRYLSAERLNPSAKRLAYRVIGRTQNMARQLGRFGVSE